MDCLIRYLGVWRHRKTYFSDGPVAFANRMRNRKMPGDNEENWSKLSANSGISGLSLAASK